MQITPEIEAAAEALAQAYAAAKKKQILENLIEDNRIKENNQAPQNTTVHDELPQENVQHRKGNNRTLNFRLALEIRAKFASRTDNSISAYTLAQEYDVTYDTIAKCLVGDTFKNAGGPIADRKDVLSRVITNTPKEKQTQQAMLQLAPAPPPKEPIVEPPFPPKDKAYA